MDLERLYEECDRGHTHITTSAGGPPRVVGTDLTVSQILGRLYVHGGIDAVVEYHRDVTREQVREAISYALLFIELACDPARAGK